MSIKRKLAGTLVSSMILTSLSVVPVFADTKGDEKTSSVVSTPSVPGFDLEYVEDEDTGSYIKRVWNVTDYNGSGKTAAITDLSEFDGFENEESGTYVRNVINLDSSDIFDPSDEIESLSIDDTSISKLSGNVFSNLRKLKEFTTDPGNKHFTAKDGLLYYDGTDVIIPKGKTGNISIQDGAETFMESLPIYRMDIGTLTFPSSFDLSDEFYLIGADVDSYAGTLSNGITKDGSLFSSDGTRLIAYGNKSSADLSKVTEANPYAFATMDVLKASNLPEAVKAKVPFSFTSGEGESYQGTRYFSINGKTAYCYNHGKKNPVEVGNMTEYNDAIADKETRDKITRLLCAGVPNDGLGMFEDVFGQKYNETAYGINGDAAKNVVGSLVWELTDNTYAASTDDVYGTGSGIFTEDKVAEYIDVLRAFAETGNYNGKNYSEDIEKNFKLGFYVADSDEYQGLIVLDKNYIPEPTPEEPEDPKPSTPSEPEKPDRPHSGGGTGGYSGWDGPDPTPSKNTPVTVVDPQKPVTPVTPVNPEQPSENVPDTPRSETTVPKTADNLSFIITLAGLSAVSLAAVYMSLKRKTVK